MATQVEPFAVLFECLSNIRLLSKLSVVRQGQSKKVLKKRSVHEVHEHFEALFSAEIGRQWQFGKKSIQGSIMRPSYVYILASQRNGTLYVGSTSDLIKRTWEHKNNVIPGFAAKYNVHMLVYYDVHELYIEAARREKRFKNWPRQWKINLIEGFNPEWRDLYEEICR